MKKIFKNLLVSCAMICFLKGQIELTCASEEYTNTENFWANLRLMSSDTTNKDLQAILSLCFVHRVPLNGTLLQNYSQNDLQEILSRLSGFLLNGIHYPMIFSRLCCFRLNNAR